ncbi:glycosyltransferase family protein 64 C3 [Cornus florida]|uniref:glycosyltransferase family protein 64 C3 n=1 Tax=Cornus florida TaxID=4283 RepID=UPI00289C0664|nr:glycosyltransferase family protein 64 C3 [Cornus florida]
MANKLSLFFFFFVMTCLSLVCSLRQRSSHLCDRKTLPDPRILRADQMTVLMNGYSESRIPLLRSIAATYSAIPSVSSVVVLWGNPSTPAQTLIQLSYNLSISSSSAPISVVRHSTDSLNARFLPRPSVTTRAVAICDDDVEIDPKSVEFAFRVWTSNQHRLVGFFARSHDIDLTERTWIYTVHHDKYSILLTKFMILKTEYLYKYSCEGGKAMMEMRERVNRMRNCEDILMNFMVSEEGNEGPILVGAERARDWGDGRNGEGEGEGEGEGREMEGEERKRVREVGLSSRRGGHRRRRGECIREFHRILGRMPLRYGYGKVVNSVGEQGLCEKGGKLVFCDQQVAK